MEGVPCLSGQAFSSTLWGLCGLLILAGQEVGASWKWMELPSRGRKEGVVQLLAMSFQTGTCTVVLRRRSLKDCEQRFLGPKDTNAAVRQILHIPRTF